MRVMALDVGARWVGVAVSDPTETLARPLEALERGSKEEDVAALADLIERFQVRLLVVGHPMSLDGSQGPQAQQIAAYADYLSEHLPVSVRLWDESFSTTEAEAIMRQNRGERARRMARSDGGLDAIAAAVILQRYLDRRVVGE